MAYDFFIADRLRFILAEKNIPYIEKTMFGRLMFMVNDKFCFGIYRNELEIRIQAELARELLETGKYKPFDSTGKRMKNYIKIPALEFDTELELERWVALSIEYNRHLSNR